MSGLIISGGIIDSSAVAQRVQNLDPFTNGFKSMDDLDSGRIFTEIFGDVCRYNATAGQYFYYDGCCWKPDPGNLQADHYAKMLARAMEVYACNVDSMEYKKWVLKLGSRRARDTMVKDSRDFMCFQQTDLDAHPEYLNLRNCTLDLLNHQTLNHDPKHLLSKCANVDYVAGARSEEWEKFIHEVMQGDEEKIHFLQMICGYALTGTAEREELYFFFGRTTRNGKSTCLDTLVYMLGDYALNVLPESLAIHKDKNGSGPSPDIARLAGCRLLQCSEPPRKLKLDVALIKQLTGGGKVSARFLNQDPFEFLPVFKLFVNCNTLPLVGDDTLFSSGRVHVLSFDKHFSKEEQDKNLKERLRSPENLSGILNWCLDGMKMYHREKKEIKIPKSVIDATEEWRQRSDKIRCFLEDCLYENPFVNTPAKAIYEAFSNWCEESGYMKESKGSFFEELRQKGLLSYTATVNGQTVKNVVKGYSLDPPQMTQMI